MSADNTPNARTRAASMVADDHVVA